jgi:hypothetical protein
MHEFEFEMRISAQIQTFKMAVGSWATFEILFEYYEIRTGRKLPRVAENSQHTCEV